MAARGLAKKNSEYYSHYHYYRTKAEPMSNKSEQLTSESSNHKWMRSEELVTSPSGLIILHNDEPYRLRITRKGKLILTK